MSLAHCHRIGKHFVFAAQRAEPERLLSCTLGAGSRCSLCAPPDLIACRFTLTRTLLVAAYTLYCFAQSGNAYKAALMLKLCGADWEPRFVDYFHGETRSPEFRAINEMGEVPILEHDGHRMSQSGVILDYLAERLGQYGGRNADERRDILRWILFDNHKLTSYTATLRFMLTFQKSSETPVTEFLRGRSTGALGVLDQHLANHAFA